MQLLKQRAEYDCVLTCLAMATGRDYDEMFPKDFCEEVEAAKGTGRGDLHERALNYSGLVRNVDFVSVHCALASAAFIRKMLWGRRALIQVPSLNYPDASHYVYWDGSTVLDPSTKIQYRWLDTLNFEWVYLLKNI